MSENKQKVVEIDRSAYEFKDIETEKDFYRMEEGLDMDRITSYVRHKSEMKNNWEDVPEDIKNTFERLGIPQAERESLAGVGAQYDCSADLENY